MRKIETIEEIQTIELHILDKVVKEFDENGISYFLAGGSMLGAVRHNGFIPWDDDIDLLVPRQDYDRIKDILTEERTKKQGISLKMPGMEGYPFPFIKVYDTNTVVYDRFIIREKFPLSVWIDIFPLDHYPDSALLHKIYFLFIKMLRTTLNTGIVGKLGKGGRLTRKLFHVMYGILGGYRKVTALMDSSGRWLNRHNLRSSHYGNGTYPEGMKDYFEEGWIFPYIRCRFEDREFNIPKNYDDYLKHFYGDYMVPPPEGQRGRHSFEAYDTSVR